MIAKFARGPWKACRSHESYLGRYWEPEDAEEAAALDAKPFVRIEAANGDTVVTAHDLFTLDPDNAALLVAAPDLYWFADDTLQDQLNMKAEFRNNYLVEMAVKLIAQAANTDTDTVLEHYGISAESWAKARGEA